MRAYREAPRWSDEDHPFLPYPLVCWGKEAQSFVITASSLRVVDVVVPSSKPAVDAEGSKEDMEIKGMRWRCRDINLPRIGSRLWQSHLPYWYCDRSG